MNKINSQPNIILRMLIRRLSDFPNGMTPSDLAEMCIIPKPSCRHALKKLRDEGKVFSTEVRRNYILYKVCDK